MEATRVGYSEVQCIYRVYEEIDSKIGSFDNTTCPRRRMSKWKVRQEEA